MQHEMLQEWVYPTKPEVPHDNIVKTHKPLWIFPYLRRTHRRLQGTRA